MFAHAKRIVIAVMGGTVVLAGLALLVLPGPGLLVIGLGLGLLAIEFAFARRWLRQVKCKATDAKNWVQGNKPAERPEDTGA